jgi:excinuclease ABC subunit C
VVELIHRSFLIPSCKVDLSRYHPRACLQYYIHRCLGPCVKELTTQEIYAGAVKDAQLFLEGRHAELEKSLHGRMASAAEAEQFELAARYRDLISTVHQLEEKQRIATADSDDADVFGYHYESGCLAANLFHIRSGKIVDRREFFWEDLPEFLSTAAVEEALADGEDPIVSDLVEGDLLAGAAGGSLEVQAPPVFEPGQFFSALLKQLYIDQQYVPRTILVPVDFEDRESLASLLAERTGHRVELAAPQRGDKRSLIDLAGQNAKQSYTQRFRVLEPSRKATQEALADALMLPDLPKRIECFDISHIQGAETVASMVVWEDGAMKKSAYRKFQVKTVSGVDDFASMREIVFRRYKRVKDENGVMPSLILIDGGLGQLHAAFQALEELGFTSQPLASIAKREEVIYVYGSEDEPVVLDRRSPVLHLVQLIRDESHRFAIGYHRKRREMRDRDSELLEIPGVGAGTRQRLLTHFGSLREVQAATAESLAAVVNKKTAQAIWAHFHAAEATASPLVVLKE